MHIEFKIPRKGISFNALKAFVDFWNKRYNYTYSFFYLDGFQLHFTDPHAYTVFALTWNYITCPFKVIQ